MELPQALQAALEDELASQPTKKLAAAVAELSHRYRAGGASGASPFIRSPEEVAAYAAFRLPATFAAVASALGQAQERLPNWTPRTLLDVGAGPGTAMWAAADTWPEIEQITLVEREEGMIALGKRLAASSPLATLQYARWLRADLAGVWEAAPHDLVVAAYVLGELTEEKSAALLQKLWGISQGVLLIVEPGTPAGFARIRTARQDLIAAGAQVIAPCPHNQSCPMPEHDWCHFSQRVARSRLHRQVKGGELPYEDEKFSYVALSCIRGTAIPGRVIRHPQIRPGHIHLEVCAPQGLTKITITRKDHALFRQARDVRWGSVLPTGEQEDGEH
ncbi:MAG TPA: small ribosomal subunit Rsm22 family protein [Ktedonobacterales bacterium]|jgi:ribosomal protein RSM22 (predicted rRNA methylase)